jgi:hypothetical protein
MPITTFRGEKTVADIADKLFARLTARQRKTVENALLKANPQLRDIASLRPGAILQVPAQPELRGKLQRALENPDKQLAGQLRDDLNAYGKRLAERSQAAQAQVAATAKLVADRTLAKTIGDDPALKALVKDIGKNNGKREQALAQRQKAFDVALEQMLDELERL